MLQTSIIPQSNQVEVHFNVPDAYVGKKIKVIAFQDDDAVAEDESVGYKPGNVARFRGALKMSDERYEEYQKFLKEIRQEWDKAL